MSSYLLWGIVGGALCTALYVSFCVAAKKTPVLGQAIELLISAVGASAGVRIIHIVITGQLARAFRQSLIPLSEEDQFYFLIGAFALFWLSLQTIIRGLWAARQGKV